MERLYASTEVTAWENNDLAIENAIETLKTRLRAAPDVVLGDVLTRCKPETHDALADWIAERRVAEKSRRVPKAWSPKRNTSVWILYTAADLDCPAVPPGH